MVRVPQLFWSGHANRQTCTSKFSGTLKPASRLSSATTHHHSTSPKPNDGSSAILGRYHSVVFATESSYMLHIRLLFLYLLFLILYCSYCFADSVLLTV